MALETGKKPHVLIIGAGIGGLFLAQFLRKRCVPFEIFERDGSASARESGWAIGLYMLEEFAQLMPDDVPPLRSACHLLPLDLPSQVILYPPGGLRFGVEDTPETPCVRANRFLLRQLLSTGVDIQWGKQAVKVEDTGTKATVSFQDGTSATGDIVIGADGTWSKVREHVLGRSNSAVLEPVPMAQIYGEVELSGAALENQFRLAYSSWIVFRPEYVLFCGLNKVSEDGRAGSYYWFLYVRDPTAASPDHWLRTATREEKYTYAINKIAELEPRFQEVVKVSGPANIGDKFSLYYDAIIKSFPVSRVTLLGDAAHPMTPFRGEGGIMAINDAMALGDILARLDINDGSAVTAALDAYQKEMTARGSESVQASRDAVENNTSARARGAPKSWGYDHRPMPEKPLPAGLQFS